LRDFYDEKDGAAFLTQLVFLVTRYHQQVGLIQRDLFGRRIIADYIFERIKSSPIRRFRTTSSSSTTRSTASSPSGFPSPISSSTSRFRPRPSFGASPAEGTALEKNISEKYLQDLIEAFDFFFFNYQAAPLLVIKSDELDLAGEGDFRDILEPDRPDEADALVLRAPEHMNRGSPRNAERTLRM